MNIEEILKEAEVAAKENMWRKPPAFPYAVYLDTKKAKGADTKNNLVEHEVIIELYTDKPDKTTENRIEKIMDKKSIKYDSLPRIYLEKEDMYMKTYKFYFKERR